MILLKGLVLLSLLGYIGIPAAGSKAPDAVPFDVIERLAVEEAQHLWNATNYGPVIPFVGLDGKVIAYMFTFKIGGEFPSQEFIEHEREEARSLMKMARDAGDNSMLEKARALYWGNDRYGTLVIGARYSVPPIFERGALLPRYYTFGRKAQRKAEEYLGEEATLTRVYYVAPDAKWYEFEGKSGKKVLVDPFLFRVYPVEYLSKIEVPKGDFSFEKLNRNRWRKIETAIEHGDLSALFAVRDSGYIPGVPFYLWSYGCSPTSSAMLMGYWDKSDYGRLVDYYFDHWDVAAVETVYNVPNVQLELAIHMHTDTITGGTTPSMVAYGQNIVANNVNSYSFISTTSSQGYSGNNWNWSVIVAEIDANRPFHWIVMDYYYDGEYIDHSVAAVGYLEDETGKYVKVHNTWDYYDWDWALAPNSGCINYVVKLIPGGGNSNNITLDAPPGEVPVFAGLPIEVRWTITGGDISYVDVYYSHDNAQTWILVGDNVPADEPFYFVVDSPTTKGRVRIEAYNQYNYLYATDGSPDNIVLRTPDEVSGISLVDYKHVADLVYDIEKKGDLLLVAGAGGLTVLGLDDEQSITFLGFCGTDGDDNFLKVRDTLIFIASKGYGLRVVNISNPEVPEEIGNYNPGDQSLALDLYGDYVLLAARLQKLRVIDVSDPTTPVEISSFDDVTAAYGVAVSGDIAYVTSLGSGLHILDISDVTNIQELSVLPTGGVPYDVAVYGNYVYIADGNAGVLVVDVSEPSSPQVVDTILLSGATKRVKVNSDHLFVLNDQEGLQIYSLADPASPTEIGYIFISPGLTAICADTPYVYFATSEECVFAAYLDCLGVQEAAGVELTPALKIYPNPTSRIASIALTMPEAEEVEIGLYDIAGRLVTDIFNGRLEKGTHVINFNAGKEISSGVYFVKARSDTFTRTGKLLILR